MKQIFRLMVWNHSIVGIFSEKIKKNFSFKSYHFHLTIDCSKRVKRNRWKNRTSEPQTIFAEFCFFFVIHKIEMKINSIEEMFAK